MIFDVSCIASLHQLVVKCRELPWNTEAFEATFLKLRGSLMVHPKTGMIFASQAWILLLRLCLKWPAGNGQYVQFSRRFPLIDAQQGLNRFRHHFVSGHVGAPWELLGIAWKPLLAAPDSQTFLKVSRDFISLSDKSYH